MADTPSAPAGPRPEQTMPLLALITQRSLDADYEYVAARKRAAGQDPSVRQVPRRTAAMVLLAFGLLVTVAAVQTSRNASVDAASRSSLIDQINLRRQAVADQQRQVSRQQADQLALQRSLTRVNTEAQATQARLSRVRAGTGFGAVKGSGVEATVASAPGSDNNQLVRDSDLTLLTDALWAAGAEAISIDGQRLGPTSAIRFAGEAVLVDFNPVTNPYEVRVIGDPDALSRGFLANPQVTALAGFFESYGMRFDFAKEKDLSLPAASLPELRSATAVPRGGSTSDPNTDPTPGG